MQSANINNAWLEIKVKNSQQCEDTICRSLQVGGVYTYCHKMLESKVLDNNKILRLVDLKKKEFQVSLTASTNV